MAGETKFDLNQPPFATTLEGVVQLVEFIREYAPSFTNEILNAAEPVIRCNGKLDDAWDGFNQMMVSVVGRAAMERAQMRFVDHQRHDYDDRTDCEPQKPATECPIILSV